MAPTQLDKRAAADYLGITIPTLDQRRTRGNFPPPDGRIGASPWWWTTTLEPLRKENAT